MNTWFDIGKSIASDFNRLVSAYVKSVDAKEQIRDYTEVVGNDTLIKRLTSGTKKHIALKAVCEAVKLLAPELRVNGFKRSAILKKAVFASDFLNKDQFVTDSLRDMVKDNILSCSGEKNARRYKCGVSIDELDRYLGSSGSAESKGTPDIV